MGSKWWWLRYLNPLIVLVDYWRARDSQLAAQRELDRLDRAADRDSTATMVRGMQDVVLKSLDAAQQNTKLFERFLATYDVAEPPSLRVFDEEEDDERYIKRKASTSSTPAALAGLSRHDQFKVILDNLDKFQVGD